MRAGGSPSTLEAAFTLRDKLPAGTWGVIGDGMVLGTGANNVRVRFEVRTRSAAAVDDRADQVLVGVENVFHRDAANPFNAVQFETAADGSASDAQAGDKLVLRIVALPNDSDPGAMYIPNADGVYHAGRIPSLKLPPSP